MSTTRSPATRLPNSRLPLLITTVSCIGIVALGWFLGVAPQLEAAALARDSLANTELQNAKHRTALLTLAEQHSRIDAIRADALSLRHEVPAGLGLPDLVDEMSAVAAAHRVVITRYAAEEPVSPLSIAVAAQPPIAPDVTDTDTDTDAAEATTAGATAEVAVLPTTPSARLTGTNLYAVPISLTLSGTPADARATVGELQHGTRLFFVTSAEFVASEPAGESLSEVRGFAYVLVGG
jgi:hypothetical protein